MVRIRIFCIAISLLLPVINGQATNVSKDLLSDGLKMVRDAFMWLPTRSYLFNIIVVCPYIRYGFVTCGFYWEPVYFHFIGATSLIRVDVTKANELIAGDSFDITKPTVLILSGWMTGYGNTEITKPITKAYLARGGINVIEVDTSSYVNQPYGYSVGNTLRLGESLAGGLQRLSMVYNIEMLHVVAFGMGAHIASTMGRAYFKWYGNRLTRITGLDPLYPCFYNGLCQGMSVLDAKLVDVIHTNPIGLGTYNIIGHIDFFVGGYIPIQPACVDIFCSHVRAIHYYAETVMTGSEKNFEARLCRPFINGPNALCNGNTTYMGFLANETPPESYGVYFLEANAVAPFGKNSTATPLSRSKRRMQRN